MPIYRDEDDRKRFLQVLAQSIVTHNITCHAFCQMTNHYHLVITTNEANLAHAMQQLNSRYAEWWSRRHDRPGHVFQGRYGAQIISTDTYLLTACVYVARNPTRAGLVASPERWCWSSYRATAGLDAIPGFLRPETVWRCLSAADEEATARYRELVKADPTLAQPLPRLPVLGAESFVHRFREHKVFAGRENARSDLPTRPSLESLFAEAFRRDDRRAAIVAARTAGYAAREIAAFLGVHWTTVSKILKRVVV